MPEHQIDNIYKASQSYTQYDLVRKPSTLDVLIEYFTPSHVIHQRLLELVRNLVAHGDAREGK